jgi:peptidoglycan/LPS O-acetylase OafA/YrhL
MKRIKGLDSVRFICALIVLFGHFGFPFITLLSKASGGNAFLKILAITISLAFNGPAAVIIFFIISGFCIHYPFRDSKTISLPPYYSRRLLRIGIPALIAFTLSYILKIELKPPEFGVFWSIFCEIAYYLIYPILFYISKIIKWRYMILAAYIISWLLIFTHLDILKNGHNGYPVFGSLNWVIGLPCWLLGCWLSVNYLRFRSISTNRIWIMRLCIISFFIVLNIIRFHVHLFIASNCITLNLFALIACAWLGFEIMYYKVKEPLWILEYSGKWSYSLYLTHPATSGFLVYIGFGALISKYVGLLLIISLIFAYLFYLIIEKPSHRLSIFISSRLSKKTQSPLATVKGVEQ